MRPTTVCQSQKSEQVVYKLVIPFMS